MKCKDVCELMPDIALGLAAASGEAGEHLRTCTDCAGRLEGMRRTMALLDEWQAPEVSPYFDTRFEARLREEKAKAAAPGFLAWIHKPVLALVTIVLLVAGVTWYRGDFLHRQLAETTASAPVRPGTPVGDLEALDNNHDMLSDFDMLDDLSVQHDVNANP
jgi:hypothetical protein